MIPFEAWQIVAPWWPKARRWMLSRFVEEDFKLGVVCCAQVVC